MSWRYAVYALARRPAQRQGHDSVSSSALRLFSSSPNVFSAETSSRTSPAMTLYNRQLNTVLTAWKIPQIMKLYGDRVLRGCVPTTRRLGSIAKRKVGRHPYDRRVREIFHNISLAGHIPTLNAYHFVMHQFAVCGDYLSTMRMYHEILSARAWFPTQQTFMLCLHSMALRLSFPVDHMKKHGIPPTAVIVDMMLPNSQRERGLEDIGRHNEVGILALTSAILTAPSQESSAHAEFTTSTLNTLINILGRLRMVSKLVQTFEVRRRLRSHYSFLKLLSSNTPSAKPNSTTYVFLIKGLCYTKQFNLARHYLIDAYRRDRRLSNEYLELANQPSNSSLRTQIFIEPRSSHSSIQSLLLQHSKTWFAPMDSTQGMAPSDPSLSVARSLHPLPRAKPKSRAACFAQSKQYLQECRKTAAEVDWLTPYYAVRAKRPTVAALDLGKNLLLAVPPDENGKRPGKYMDVDVHINILKRDILLFNHLTKLVESALSRQHHKTVSTIGRRVWRGTRYFPTNTWPD
ncbi:hypothetical protein DL96DRAFT_1787161 [Flagelloscypha sp. PMI_526]|nr:hypothetical protein DL96DRAFT_1787161 [Flagelloscypha sp. PMI_526]